MGPGRLERRTLTATTALNGYLDWLGVGQVGRVESVVDRDGKRTAETRYLVTSVPRELADARGPAGMGAGPLDGREPVALRARREHGPGRQPDPQGVRPGGDGGAAVPGHRLPALDRGREHR